VVEVGACWASYVELLAYDEVGVAYDKAFDLA
jgi:hypothetical protein